MPFLILVNLVATYLSLLPFLGLSDSESSRLLPPAVGIFVLCGVPVAAGLFGILISDPSQATHRRAEFVFHGLWLVSNMALCFGTSWIPWICTSLDANVLQLFVAITPSLVSLLLIWQVFDHFIPLVSDRKKARVPIHSIRVLSNFLTQWRTSLCRFKIHVLTTMIPMMGVLFIQDLSEVASTSLPLIFKLLILLLAIVTIAISFPALVCMILPNKHMTSIRQGQDLLELAKRCQIKIHSVRIWNTDNRILNALVVGMTPFYRTILLTDRLIAEMEPNEVKAIFLHELGHLKHRHLTQRFFASAIPFVFTYLIGVQCSMPEAVILVVAFTISIFSFLLVAHSLEYEADQYAAKMLQHFQLEPQSLSRALEKIRIWDPRADNFSWLHPTINQRIAALRNMNPHLIKPNVRES